MPAFSFITREHFDVVMAHAANAGNHSARVIATLGCHQSGESLEEKPAIDEDGNVPLRHWLNPPTVLVEGSETRKPQGVGTPSG
ncbi:MAG TPA: hypothetical protein ENI94_13230 [Gammaproteobacteria bacterium]|nr:hypothetical protein [Gammaproteobacteria bacterium]